MKDIDPKQGLDSILHSQLSKIFGLFSPASFFLAYFDWIDHLSISVDKRMALANSAMEKYGEFLQSMVGCIQDDEGTEFCCKPDDQRFTDKAWKKFPFNAFAHTFLLCEQWWNEATTNIPGATVHHEKVVNFMVRQFLDAICPANFPMTNPEVLRATVEQNGENFVRGRENFHEDFNRIVHNELPKGTENFKVGKNVAVTPGKVIYRNHLIELIQYDPTTKTVEKEPVLIVPAWIMKYYILDLSPHNSMVKYLVSQGHTVFMISWRNPESKDQNLGLDDYLNIGVLEALTVVQRIVPNTKVNAVGYCIGGTLLMIAAAYLAGKGEDGLNTITLFAAQIDFKDAGELLLFIDESQIFYLESIMWEKGYLDGARMAGTFGALHSAQLVWSRMIREYLLGCREPVFDLMAWDYDTTRLPYRMHSEYLRKLFLHNELIQGKFIANGNDLRLLDINVPIFAVSTMTDHIAPWKSVYKINLFTKTDVTFVLTSGGHNAGIVSEPGHKGRTFQLLSIAKEDKRLTATQWEKEAPVFEGSWWPEWHQWLTQHSESNTPVKARVPGDPSTGFTALIDAPGTYVLQK